MPAPTFYDRVKHATATAGTGTMTLGAASAGYRAMPAAADGLTVTYVIEDGASFEVGKGVYTHAGTTLTRATVETSSAGGTTKIALSGAATVFVGVSAADLDVLSAAANASQGDLLYRGAAGWGRLAAGTSGQVLKTLGAGANPAWTTPPLAVQDHFYKVLAEANMTMTQGVSGTLYDRVVDKGGFVILALAGMIVGTTLRPGTTYTVPAGKIAVGVDMRFDINTLNNPTFYKHRLFNVTAAAAAGGPNSTMFGGNWTAYGGGTSTWPSQMVTINVNTPMPFQVATAGQVLRADIGGGGDANARPTFGMYVLAIIDATTHLLEPVT